MDLKNNQRAVIENIRPAVDGGRFPIKRTLGDRLRVEADIFTDGHDTIRCVLHYRWKGDEAWHTLYMKPSLTPLGQDRWQAEFPLEKLGRYQYRVSAWVDHFESWRHDLARRKEVDDIAINLQIGAMLVLHGAQRASSQDAEQLREW